MNHLQACGHCPKYEHGDGTQKSHTGCETYADVTWVNRLGGCGMFPLRDIPELPGGMKKRVGQQKQTHSDRKYDSKNDRRTKFKRYE